MLVHWRACPDALTQALRQHGAEPDAVADVGLAWRAFSEFLQVAVEGVDTRPDEDADGFIVQWGRYSWNRHLPSLSFTRQLAVVEGADQTDPDWQPDLWQLDLALVFEDEPDLRGLNTLERQDTGFSFTPIGPDRGAELAELPVVIHQYPPLLAAWSATPVETRLSFEQVC